MTKEMTQWMNERCQCPFKYCNDQNFALECVGMYLCMKVIFENTSPPPPAFPAYLFIVSKQPSTQDITEVCDLKKYLFLFIYLAALGLSCCMWNLVH